MICIEHFRTEDYAVKSKKYCLKNFAIPTVFPAKELNVIQQTGNQLIQPSENQLTNACAKCVRAEEEIQFLRHCLAGLEVEKDSMEKRLNETVRMQEDQLNLLSEKVNELERTNEKFETGLVRFVVDNNPKVMWIESLTN